MSQISGSQKRKSKIDNKRSLLLNANENKLLFGLLGSGCVSMAAAVVQLFQSDTRDKTKWIKQGTGVAVFVRDANEHSYFIRIYDLIDEKMVWQQEVYTKFKYLTAKDFFHTFECDNFEAGLNFASEDEAELFKIEVQGKLRSRKKRRLGKSKSGKNAADLVDPSRNTGTEHRKKSSPLGKSSTSKGDIGSPTNYRIVSSVSYKSEKGITCTNVDPDIKELFQHVGIDNNDAVDEDTMDFIYDFVEQHGGMNELKKEISRRPPPPVPSSDEQEESPPRMISNASSSTRRRPPPPPSEQASLPSSQASAHVTRPPVPSLPKPDNDPPSVSVPPPPPGNVPAPPPPPPPPPIGGGPGLLKSSVANVPPTTPVASEVGQKNRPPPHSARNARADLMESIISSSRSSLKPIAPSASTKRLPVQEDAGIVGALARALAMRKTSMAGGSDGDSDEEDDFEDDEDWD